MGPPSRCAGRTSLLKRKRTTSEEEDLEADATFLKHMQNDTPAEAWGPPSELSEGDVVDLMLSPDSIPSSELCLGSPCDDLTASDTGEAPSSDSDVGRCRAALEKVPPVPSLAWADARHVWGMLCAKDEDSHHQRDARLFQRHPGLTPRMRAILLDWLIEVCEVYKLHRQTYHLCMDFIDRYLSRQRNIPKQQLQLIGITCLFIAAKVEEIYPPKIKEFAYVTDGACTEEEIMDKELVILKVLQWGLGPMTAMGWLCVFLQTLAHMQQQQQQQRLCGSVPSSPSPLPSPGVEAEAGETMVDGAAFELPQLSGQALAATAALLDLATLDEGSLRFRYAPLAAAALALTCSTELALCVSGLSRGEVQGCCAWMLPFAEALHEAWPAARVGVPPPPPPLPPPPSLDSAAHAPRSARPTLDDSHNIQVHTIDLRLLERAHQHRDREAAAAAAIVSSPVTPVTLAPGLLTPPASGRKAAAPAAPKGQQAQAQAQARHAQPAH